MKVRRVMWGLGGILVFFAATFVLPAMVAVFYDVGADVPSRQLGIPGLDWGFSVPDTMLVFLASGTITATLGLLLQYFGVEGDDLRPREAYAIVGLGWLVIALLGALPYLGAGALKDPSFALFESMSGFTTTGATVFRTVEDQPPSILFWRALTQWIGGGGIIVLTVAVLAGLTHGGHQLMAAESSAVKGGERLRPKVKETAKVLWGVYAWITALLIVGFTASMHLTGTALPLKEAFLDGTAHAFTAVATGGFSTRDASIAFYDSIWVDGVAVVGMLLGGLSFPLIYLALRDRAAQRLFGDPETRFFLAVAGLTVLFVAAVLWRDGFGFGEAFRAATVQSLSIITTTGFTPYTFTAWPEAARLVLLFMFFTGASTGSTSGAMKAVRILVLFKLVRREIRRLLHPRAIIPLRVGSRILNDDTIKTVIVFFFTYITLVLACTIVLTLQGIDMIAAGAASATAIGNVGPGLNSTFANMVEVPLISKLALTFLMWAGRLEIFTVLILFSRETWKR